MAGTTSVEHLLDGAIDTHMHTSPSVFDRHDTDFEAARKARDAGMRAICIKSHHFETAARAQTATDVTGFDVLGGVTLNEWVGGMNPLAVEGAANLGAAIVWMPTITATHHIKNWGYLPHLEHQSPDPEDGESPGISVLTDDGDLTQSCREVLGAVADNDLVLALSHLSPAESFAVVEDAVNRGVEEFLLTHPHAEFLDYSHEQMRELADYGVTMEIHYAFTTELTGCAATIDDFVETIDEVGVENVVMATDGGAVENDTPLEMFRAFVREMLEAGVAESEIETMITTNPRTVFGLS